MNRSVEDRDFVGRFDGECSQQDRSEVDHNTSKSDCDSGPRGRRVQVVNENDKGESKDAQRGVEKEGLHPDDFWKAPLVKALEAKLVAQNSVLGVSRDGRYINL
jgi:hypothetical protein